MEKLFKAIEISSRAHNGQKRKGENPPPYICHPFFVGLLLLKLGYDEKVVSAGILHDVIEDGFKNLKREDVENIIKENFGDEILDLVKAQTEPKDPNMSKEEKIRTWEIRNQTKLEKLKNSSPEVRAISAVDLLSNLIELHLLFQSEGKQATKYFNVDIKKKISFMEKQLEIFKNDKDAPYSQILPEIENYLQKIKKILVDWENF
jgi:(p)ppGpp synthase/HD superfamily hydrolase